MDQPAVPAAPSRRYPFRVEVRATLRDTDGLGHVNNVVYLSWIEEARTRYVFGRRGLRDVAEVDFILASTRIDYRSPVLLHEVVDVWCGPSRVGSRSWELQYEARARCDGRLVAEASSVQVQYDYSERKAVPVPEPFRSFLQEDLIA